MLLFLFFGLLRWSIPSCNSVGTSGYSRLLLCKLWSSLWPKAVRQDLIWRCSSRKKKGDLFNTFLHHRLERDEMEFDVTSILPRRERKILENIYDHQGDWKCETLGVIFQPTQVFFASSSLMKFWYAFPEDVHLIFFTSHFLAPSMLLEPLLLKGNFLRTQACWMVGGKKRQRTPGLGHQHRRIRNV